MIHYLTLGDAERPITFSYSVAYEYEMQTGKFYEADVQDLARQVIMAGAAIGTDDVGAAARTISIVKFVDILFTCLVVGYRKTGKPVDFSKYDVADWLGGNMDTVSRFTSLLLEANFSLPSEAPASAEATAGEAGNAKKKSQAR